jgi:tetratricopeptide (TPR) repeat protein
MEIPLASAGRRLLLLCTSFAIAAILVSQAGVIWLATHRLESEQLAQMERGADLIPKNGAAWDRLGRLYQWDFVNADLARAIADYQHAVRDDPRSSHYWMDLASAYESSGDNARAQDAYEHAQTVYPLSAEVAFNYGNFLLREQKYPEAYAKLQQAVRTDPTLLPLAISRTWRSGEDVNQLLDQVLPADTDAYLQTLDFFAAIHKAEPGLAVWRRLIALGQPIPLARTLPFLDEVIREDRADDARRIWIEALTAAGLPHNAPANHSLIWDGDFAQDFENGGLGWRWNNVFGAEISFDSGAPPSGVRAVRVDFTGGTNLALDGPSQYVPVEPGRTYHFHAYLRTERITTESGVQYSVTDPNHANTVNVTTDSFTGTHAWTAVEADVPTGAVTHFLLVRLNRNPSRLFDNKIEGTAWIAGVSLVSVGAESEQPGR